MSWQIFLNGLTGKTTILRDISPKTTVGKLRELASNQSGISLAELRLVFAAKELDDSKKDMTLEDLGMGNESNVYALLRLRGGSRFSVTVLTQSFGNKIVENARAGMSYGEFEAAVLHVVGKSALKGKVRILCEGKALDKQKSLGGNNIRASVEVELLFKWLDPAVDKKVDITDDPDSTTYDSSPDNLRAKFACGHSFTPEVLTVQAISLIKENLRTEIPCIMQKGCGKIIDYNIFKFAAKLTDEERKFFETKLSSNYMFSNPNVCQCPKCHNYCWRDDVKLAHVQCPYCAKEGKRTEFCFYCLRAWKGEMRGSDCGNKECKYIEGLEKLLASPDLIKTIGEVKNVPIYRACPNDEYHTQDDRPYPVIIAHLTACKHMKCTVCDMDFCFICLKPKFEGRWQCGEYFTPCAVARAQKLQQYKPKKV